MGALGDPSIFQNITATSNTFLHYCKLLLLVSLAG
jgi:hypothetical protein